MSIMNVSPTRMELSRLKKQLSMSLRGHKLLKDKQDELMRQFISVVKEAERLRRDVEKRYREVRRKAFLAGAPFPDGEILSSAFNGSKERTFTVRTENRMGVYVPVPEFDEPDENADDSLSLSPALDESRREMLALFEDMLRLADHEKHSVVLASEIEKTRRRVNALEYMTIPQLEETIRFIKMRLEDSERDRITRLIKMQEQT